VFSFQILFLYFGFNPKPQSIFGQKKLMRFGCCCCTSLVGNRFCSPAAGIAVVHCSTVLESLQSDRQQEKGAAAAEAKLQVV
jgi:hypothetical protein